MQPRNKAIRHTGLSRVRFNWQPGPVFFRFVVAFASLLAGAIGLIAGFGIGSILTQLLALKLGAHRSKLNAVERELLEGGWVQVRDEVEARLIPIPESGTPGTNTHALNDSSAKQIPAP